MSFWSNAGEPLRQYRWIMAFGGNVDFDQHVYALKKVDKPKAKIEEITHKYLNHFFYYPGRLSWEPINLTIAAVTNPSVDDTLYKVLAAAGYMWPTTEKDTELKTTISKNKFGSAIGKNITIKQINSGGVSIEEWNLTNPFFTSVQFGSLDYSSEEIVEIQCTIRYDRAELNAKVTAAGTPTGEI